MWEKGPERGRHVIGKDRGVAEYEYSGAGEAAQQLRALTALLEDPVLFPISTGWLTPIFNSSPKGIQFPFPAFLGIAQM